MSDYIFPVGLLALPPRAYSKVRLWIVNNHPDVETIITHPLEFYFDDKAVMIVFDMFLWYDCKDIYNECMKEIDVAWEVFGFNYMSIDFDHNDREFFTMPNRHEMKKADLDKFYVLISDKEELL